MTKFYAAIKKNKSFINILLKNRTVNQVHIFHN